jgi:hypothetical protein
MQNGTNTQRCRREGADEMDHIFLGEFAYPGLSKAYPGRCGLSVWRHGAEPYAVVIASELPTNPGASITNAYEGLATHVLRQLWPQVPPWGTLWFEHYPPGLGIEDAHHYDLVTFAEVRKQVSGVISYYHPSWRRVSRAWVAEALGVAPDTWLTPWDAAPHDTSQRAFDPTLMHRAPSAISGIHCTN